MAIKFLNTVQVDTDVLYVDAANDRVGIGTDSPTEKLEVDGRVKIQTTAGSLIIQESGAGSVKLTSSATLSIEALSNFRVRTGPLLDENFTVLSTGNVGIGTTSPDAKLHIEDTSGANIILNSATGAVKSGIYLTEGATSAPKQVGAYLSYDGSSNKFSIATGVGVPADKLTIARDTGLLQLNSYGAGTLVSDASGNITAEGGAWDGPYLPLAGGTMTGTITMSNNRITSIEELRFNNGGNIDNQINTDVDTGTETVANVAIATYTAAFFDFVIKKTTNVRSGTVYACHDGTNVEFTETSTNDLGDASDVTLSVDISGANMRLLATVTSDDWSVKSLIRAI